MGYYFECPACTKVIPLDETLFDRPARSCSECGVDLCTYCVVGYMCVWCDELNQIPDVSAGPSS